MNKLTEADLRFYRKNYTGPSGTEVVVAQLLDHIEAMQAEIKLMHPPVLDIDGKIITRKEVIEGLRICYADTVKLAQQDDSTTTSFPDMEAMLDHIEQHGLEPKA